MPPGLTAFSFLSLGKLTADAPPTRAKMHSQRLAYGTIGAANHGRTTMDARTFSLTASAIFALVAVAHLLRAFAGWPVIIDTSTVPIWVSWFACVVAAALAWVGYAAYRR